MTWSVSDMPLWVDFSLPCKTHPVGEKWTKFINSERWDALWLFIVSKALVVVAAALVTWAWKDYTQHKQLLIVIAVFLYSGSFLIDGLTKLSERRRKVAVEARADQVRSETTRNICHSFSSIPQHTTSFLTQVRAGDAEARSHLDRYFTYVMDTLTKAIAVREPRVCLYMVDRAESLDGNGEGAISLLLCGNGVGRSDPPRSAFDATTLHGKFVIQRMNERRPIIVRDADEPPSELAAVLDCSGKYYKSFIAVPVTYNDHEYGMLMVDSTERLELTEDHQVVAQLFGRFLGSGFHIVQHSPASPPRVSVPRVSVASTIEGGE